MSLIYNKVLFLTVLYDGFKNKKLKIKKIEELNFKRNQHVYHY